MTPSCFLCPRDLLSNSSTLLPPRSSTGSFPLHANPSRLYSHRSILIESNHFQIRVRRQRDHPRPRIRQPRDEVRSFRSKGLYRCRNGYLTWRRPVRARSSSCFFLPYSVACEGRHFSSWLTWTCCLRSSLQTYIFEIVEVVPEPGQPQRKHRLKLLCQDDSKGAVTALANINGYLVSSMAHKVSNLSIQSQCLLSFPLTDPF
jgi:hypothetical protein